MMKSIRMEIYTEEQRIQNFSFLLQAIKTLEEGRITEDWMEEHKRRIWLYRTWFYDFGSVNDQNNDRQYRAAANIAEECLSRLIEEIKDTGTFTSVIYLKFNLNVKFMASDFFNQDNLSDFMNNLKI